MQAEKMAELEQFHARAAKKQGENQNGLRAVRTDGELYEVPNGKSDLLLRESSGFSRKGDLTLYLWEEEVLYARSKGLLACGDQAGAMPIPAAPPRRKEVYSFYASMRNQGKFLTRSPVLETDPEISAQKGSEGSKLVKRQRLDE